MQSVQDQVIDFYYTLFDEIFSIPFKARIKDRLKRDAVIREVQGSAGAASQSLTRFFLNERLGKKDVMRILRGLNKLSEVLKLSDISNPNVTPESLVEELLTGKLVCPEAISKAGGGALYRVALHSVMQVLMLVGPVMAEWQRLTFASTFELPRRVANRLNQVSDQLDVLARSGEAAADERYELTYRDYLHQQTTSLGRSKTQPSIREVPRYDLTTVGDTG